MTDEPNLVDRLRAWHDESLPDLEDEGVGVEFTEPAASRPKTSASVTLSSTHRIGKLTIWATGETELDLADALSGEVTQEHREISGKHGLLDATETLLAWVRRA